MNYQLFNSDWLKKNRSIFIDFFLLLDEPTISPAKYDPFRVTAAYWYNPYIKF